MKKTALFLIAALLLALLAVPAAAVDFTPSVEQKAAPELGSFGTENGVEIVGLICNEQGEVLLNVPAGWLIVTPVSMTDGTEVGKALTKAYSQIKNARSLAEFVPGIVQYLEANGGVQLSNLVVRDLFDVSVDGTYKEYLDVEGSTITVRFNLGLSPDAFLMVLHNYEGSEWEIIPNTRVVRHENGSVDVTFDSLSPVAFVVKAPSAAAGEAAPASPETGVSSFPAAGIAVLLLCGAALIGAVLFRKKHPAA